MNSDIAGIKIPDSKMARDLTQLVRDTEPNLFHHSEAAKGTYIDARGDA
jgi:hypothetical protein